MPILPRGVVRLLRRSVLLIAALAILAAAQEETFDEQFALAESMLRRRRYEDALKAFRKANKMQDNRCVKCLWGMAQSYDGLAAFKNVIETAERIVLLAAEDKPLCARAYNLKAVALMALAENKDQKKLKEAETQLENALAANPDFLTAQFNRGVLYLQQNRDAEGLAELRGFIAKAPKHDQVAQARRFIENPRRAREPFAPDFSFTSVQGEYVDSEELRGKIVLLDFWGTWCPPCVESVPGLRNINKRLDPERVVMIAISSDSDEDKWRSFIEKEKMVWPQYLDRDRKVHSAFRVNVFPTYVLIDQDGVIRYRTIGGGWFKNAFLEDEIKKLLKKASAARAEKM